MSLRHALLGMLAGHQASGYDLTRIFDESLGRYAWNARHSQIYPELNRLADEGLVYAVGEDGPRGRRTYALADEGLAELRRWMMDVPRSGAVRNEYVLRLFLLGALDPGDARKFLERYAAEGEAEAAGLRAVREEVEQQPVLGFGRLAAEFGLRHYEMQRDWAHWAIEQLDAEQAGETGDQHDQSQPERLNNR